MLKDKGNPQIDRKHEMEMLTQKVMNPKFNNVTQKGKVENQNQEHNIIKEGVET